MDWITDYEKMINNFEVSLPEVKGYLLKYRPSKLYKYISLESTYWKDIFEQGLYLAKPEEFNDPYDALPKIDYNELFSVPKFRRLIFQKFPQLCEADLNNVKENSSIYSDLFNQSIRNDIRIICLSSTYDSLLMWSHYGNNHKGICVELDINRFGMTISDNIFPVIYSNERLDITKDILQESKNAGLKALVYKSPEWEYEQEWRFLRMIKLGRPMQKKYIKSSDKISKVIYGAQCQNQGAVKYINEFCEKNNIETQQLNLNNEKYKLV